MEHEPWSPAPASDPPPAGRPRRSCARPGCGDPAVATLSFDYAGQQLWLDHLVDERDPSTHDLCARHADRLAPPVGWDLDDRRVPVADLRDHYRAEAS